ncbi:MAG: tetratricopeptide repeat protein [Nannocystaceae bacterium]|nr:tetratricopeptide repeat protein [bacterium]
MDGRTETLLAHASAYVSAGRLAEAEGAYNAVLEAHPDEHRAHLGLADCVAARGLSDWAVDHLVEHARAYAEQQAMRGAFALMTKALAIAPGRLDLHIDVAEFEALDGRAEMAALRLENLARTYLARGQEEEAELVLDAAAAFRSAPEPDDFDEPELAPFINPHTGVCTPGPRPAVSPESSTVRVTASPPPPPPRSKVASAPPTPPATKQSTRVLAAPPAPPKKKRASRGRASGAAPKWRPSTVVNDPPPRRVRKKPAPAPPAATTARMALRRAPRPPKTAAAMATYEFARPSIAAAPSPKNGGKTLDKLPPLPLAARLRATSAGVAPPADEDRTATWRAAT